MVKKRQKDTLREKVLFARKKSTNYLVRRNADLCFPLESLFLKQTEDSSFQRERSLSIAVLIGYWATLGWEPSSLDIVGMKKCSPISLIYAYMCVILMKRRRSYTSGRPW